DQPFDAGAREVLGLAERDHFAREEQRTEEVVGEGEMVAGQDDRPFPRHVLHSLGPGAEYQVKDGPQDGLDHPVQHSGTSSRRRASVGLDRPSTAGTYRPALSSHSPPDPSPDKPFMSPGVPDDRGPAG